MYSSFEKGTFRYPAFSSSGLFFGFQPFGLPNRIIGNNQLYGVQNHHDTRSFLVQILSGTEFQMGNVNKVFPFSNPNTVGKIPDGIGCIASSSKSRNGGHSRVVPSLYHFILYQFQQFSFAYHRVTQVSPANSLCLGRNFLGRTPGPKPIVKFPMGQNSKVQNEWDTCSR